MRQTDPRSGRMEGLLKILRFNWPWYAGALMFNIIACLLLSRASGLHRVLGLGALSLVDAWIATSLAVSHWIYDRSTLAREGWLDQISSDLSRILILHAGQDEASSAIHNRFPSAHVEAFDFFSPSLTPEPSLARARASRLGASLACPLDLRKPETLPGPVDLACVIFAAHELREPGPRSALFSLIAKALAPKGRVIVAEHLRDAWNFAVYGPGCLHFLPRSEWENTFCAAGLRIAEERKITPFVSVFTLEAR